MQNKPGVYILEFPTGIYVGSSKHIRRRVLRHIADFKRGTHSNRFLQRVFEKHGEPVAHVYLYCAEADVLKQEQFAIDMFKPRFNLTPTAGRNTGHKHSTETREQMRKASREAWKTRDRTVSEEQRRLLSIAGKGRNHTEETKLKMSRSKKGVKKPDGFGDKLSRAKRGKKINQRGHPQTQESISKMRVTKMLKKYGIPKPEINHVSGFL